MHALKELMVLSSRSSGKTIQRYLNSKRIVIVERLALKPANLKGGKKAYTSKAIMVTKVPQFMLERRETAKYNLD